MAFDLRAARSRNAEIGSKWRWGEDGMLDVALFHGHTRNALGVDSSEGGRTTYRNIGRARRQGVELQSVVPIAKDWTLRTAYTWLDARVDLDARSCATAAACTTGGNRLPGVPRHALDFSVNWAGRGGWRMGLDGQAIGTVPVNDANTATAPGFALLGAHLGYRKQIGWTCIDASLRLHNLLDHRHVSAVVVNQAQGRYFEPGPGRGVFIGIRITHAATKFPRHPGEDR
jgi:iron complex outermembrane receptor protein